MGLADTPDTRSSIVITKQMTYRGATRTFSNRYHFEGDTPTSNAEWVAFADAIVAAEKAIYDDSIEIVEAVGNDKATATVTNKHGDAVFTKVYAVAGTADFSTDGRRAPGDCASMLRYATTARSSKNHPVYLFNYFHGVYQQVGDPDAMSLTQTAHINTYGTAWLAGFSDGTETHERCGPHGAVAVSRLCDGVVRHRDFPA
jgi:hypothetical protein